MQESTKSRLTVFSRLWAIPMVLCVLLCVAAVIAGMNGRTHWMGLSVLGTVLMVIILLAQLVAAAVIRRWLSADRTGTRRNPEGRWSTLQDHPPLWE